MNKCLFTSYLVDQSQGNSTSFHDAYMYFLKHLWLKNGRWMEWLCMATKGLVNGKEEITCELGQGSGYGKKKNQRIAWRLNKAYRIGQQRPLNVNWRTRRERHDLDPSSLAADSGVTFWDQMTASGALFL